MTGEQIGGIIRLLLNSGGGWVIATFGFTDSQWQAVCGGIAILVAGMWSWYAKKNAATALADAKR